MKAIIFDSSTLISFAMNGLFEEIKKLKEIFNGKFLITKEVKYEIIDRPINTKRFELEAMRIKKLLEEKILEFPSVFELNEEEISKETLNIMNSANKIFWGRSREIRLIDLGESSCLALSRMLDKKGIKNAIATDERTIRLFLEKPENLTKLLEKKMKIRVTLNQKDYKFFKEFKIIRSTELIYVLYKKGLIELKDKNALDAFLYAMKFKGCAISDEEIEEIKRMEK